MKKNILINFLLFILCFVILALSIRGYLGNPTSQQLNQKYWKENGPFELSPERGRFALVYSFLEDKSLTFSMNLAHFTTPDLAVYNGKYVSLFAPGVSFITMPGYLIGKIFNASQVGTFAVVSLFAVANFFLIKQIAQNLGATNIASTLGAFVFLFATPAFSYAVNLYQHHISTFLILFSIFALQKFKTFFALITVFFLSASAIVIDNPNLFFMFPVGLYAFFKVFDYKKINSNITLSIKLPLLITLFSMIIPISLFLWFNKSSHDNPFQLSGTLKTVEEAGLENNPLLKEQGLQGLKLSREKTQEGEKQAVNFFETRNLTNGLYLHFFSPDRGIINYTPIMFLSLSGIYLAFRNKLRYLNLFLAIIGANILLYSMWGDPWGGWAFGSRYLIPSFSILSILLALAISKWGKNILFLLIFIGLFLYSVSINTLGAITSSANPPQVQVLELEKLSGTVQKYTYERNLDFLLSNNSKSLVFRTVASNYFTALQYYYFILALITVPFLGLISIVFLETRRKK